MPRAVLVMLLVALLLAGSLHAQRRSEGSLGQGAGAHFAGQRDFAGGFHPGNGISSRGFSSRNGFSSRQFRSRRFDNSGSVFFPYFDALDYNESYPEAEPAALLPPVALSRIPDTPPPARPLVIEVPRAANASIAKAPPPTIFILANGERLEIRRYMLTVSTLSVNIDRQQRTIPVDMLDLNATLAANRERGVDLEIPGDRNEISVSF